MQQSVAFGNDAKAFIEIGRYPRGELNGAARAASATSITNQPPPLCPRRRRGYRRCRREHFGGWRRSDLRRLKIAAGLGRRWRRAKRAAALEF